MDQHLKERNSEKRMVIGIDPGQTGGIAFLSTRYGFRLEKAARMPIVSRGSRKLVHTPLLDAALRDALLQLETPIDAGLRIEVVLEQVNAMPKQGSVSGFNFGRMTGAVEGWAMSLKCPVHFVTPAVWKKRMGLTSEKKLSFDLARLEFGPDPRWEVKANEGLCEAALLALYWLRHGNGS